MSTPYPLTQFPIVGPIVITQGYGGDLSHGNNRWAIDFAASQGTEVRPVLPGVVVAIRTGSWNGDTAAGGYGNFVTIRHAFDGVSFFATYAHLSADYVDVDDEVGFDTVIGLVGNTGYSFGAHLHLHFGTGTTGEDGEGTGNTARANSGGDEFPPAFFATFFGTDQVGAGIDVFDPRPGDIFGTGNWGGDEDDPDGESDELVGTSADNRIFGGDGPDRLEGGGGHDQLFGGTGEDTASFNSNRADATVVRFGSMLVVRTPAEGVDRLHSMEVINFEDEDLYADEILEFDGLSYIASYSDLVAALGDDAQAGAAHFLEYGLGEGRAERLFDPLRYIASYTDLIAAFGGSPTLGAQHFIRYGIAEGRSATAFDPLQYLAGYTDLLAAFGTDTSQATLHYLNSGLAQGRARDAFDELRYLASYDDLLTAFGGNLSSAFGATSEAVTRHWVYHGYSEGRSAKAFDPAQYIASHPDLIKALGDDLPLGTQHFIYHGFGETRARDTFDAAQYLANYADLQAAFGSDSDAATLHHIRYGYLEGRTDDPLGGLISIDLEALTASQGFRIDGAAARDASGYSVASAGDINGDGFDDLIVGAYSADPGGRASAGSSYVVFGKASGLTNIDLAILTAAQGFRMDGVAAYDQSGLIVASAGDINGDGFDDVIVGARTAAPGGRTNAGSSYVVFGKASGFSNIDLATLRGAQGFRIDGAAADTFSGFSVASAGDVNGDGFDDLIVGAYLADPGGFGSGCSYVVFGKASGLTNIDLAILTAAQGFRIDGAAPDDLSGSSVASAGDINGDGFDDLIVGARTADPGGRTNAGSSYVLFGRASGLTNIDLATLTEAQGFRIDGAEAYDISGYSVANAGDINGDGFDDLVVGSVYADPEGRLAAGSSYVVFGRASGFAGIDLATLTGAQGFHINGAASSDASGWSVASAGDVNGDGFDDLIVGAPAADPGGFSSGSSYVVFGKPSGFSNIDLATLTVAQGFRIDGVATADGSGISVASAGDINGDGFDDVIVGAMSTDLNGRVDAGSSYVLFGGAFGAWTAPVNIIGTTAAEILIGGAGDDLLTGGGGADVFRTGAGDDRIVVADTSFARIDGGTGQDTLALSGSGQTLDLASAAFRPPDIVDIERIDLTGTGNNSLRLTRLDVFDLTNERTGGVAILRVNGNAGDTVNFADSGWDEAGSVLDSGITYTRWVNSGAEVWVAQAAAVSGASLDVAALAAAQGFRMPGALAGGDSGHSGSSVGPIGLDGYDDLFFGAVDMAPTNVDPAVEVLPDLLRPVELIGAYSDRFVSLGTDGQFMRVDPWATLLQEPDADEGLIAAFGADTSRPRSLGAFDVVHADTVDDLPAFQNLDRQMFVDQLLANDGVQYDWRSTPLSNAEWAVLQG